MPTLSHCQVTEPFPEGGAQTGVGGSLGGGVAHCPGPAVGTGGSVGVFVGAPQVTVFVSDATGTPPFMA